MTKTLPVTEARKNLTSLEVYEQWRQSRNAFFEKVRDSARRANLSEQEANKLADKSVRAIRQSPKP